MAASCHRDTTPGAIVRRTGASPSGRCPTLGSVSSSADAAGPVANRARAERDLAEARQRGDGSRVAVLEALVACPGPLLVYQPDRQRYAVVLGDLEGARHVALMVPGVSTELGLLADWLASAENLLDAAPATAVILWKDYDDPPDATAAALASVACNDDVSAAAADLTQFVGSLPLRSDQSLTLVAHSFGSLVTGAALADHGLECTDVVLAGGPGMTVDELRQLHVSAHRFFSEEVPAGSASLADIADVVTGRNTDVVVQPPSGAEVAGALTAWAIRVPLFGLVVLLRHYHGPGHRVLRGMRLAVDLTASQTGSLVRVGLDAGGRIGGLVVRQRPIAEVIVRQRRGTPLRPSAPRSEGSRP
jgi:pimeloyl-ACP methyl ester carboxylesterase